MEISQDFSNKKSAKQAKLVLSALFISAVLLLFWFFQPILLWLTVFILAVIILAYKLEYGLFIMTALAFFHGWMIDFARFESLRQYPFLASLNAPLIDFWTVFVLGVGILVVLIKFLLGQKDKNLSKKFPGLVWYGLFLLISYLAAWNAFDHNIKSSLWYSLRFMTFVYLGFFLLPYHLLNTKKILARVMNILVWVGVVISLYAFSSIFIIDQEWFRLVPYAIKGFAPLGFNHNAVSQPLTIILPISFYLFLKNYNSNSNKTFWYGFSTTLILFSALLTLSRAAWIAIFVQILIVAWFFKGGIKKYWQDKNLKKYTLPGAVVLLFVVGYMLAFTVFSQAVVSSNVSRIHTTEMSAFYFLQSPWLGHGPGMYTRLLSQNAIHLSEYGEPLESHGFIQKILVEEGVFALLLFFGFLYYVFKRLWPTRMKLNQDYLTIFLLAMAVGSVVLQLFDTLYFNAVMWFPLGLAIGAHKVIYEK